MNNHFMTQSPGNAIPTGITTSKIPHFEELIFDQWAEDTPLVSLMSMCEAVDLNSIYVMWREQALRPVSDTTNDATLTGTTGVTPMVVTNIAYWDIGSQVINRRTKEHALVTAVDVATSTVTLGVRGVGGAVAAAGINDGDTWNILAVARKQASGPIPAHTVVPSIAQNVCQFMSATLEETYAMLGVRAKADMGGSSGKDDWVRNMRLIQQGLKVKLEATLFHGHYAVINDTVGGSVDNQRSLMGGLEWFLRSSPTSESLGGKVLTWPFFRGFLGNYQAKNPIKTADIIARPQVMQQITHMFADGAMKTLEKLPSGLIYNVQQIQLMNTTYRFHSNQVLDFMDDNNIYVLDFSGTNRKDRPIKLGYAHAGGSPKETDGHIQWIEGQGTNGFSAQKSQCMANITMMVKGYTLGRHAILSGAAWQ